MKYVVEWFEKEEVWLMRVESGDNGKGNGRGGRERRGSFILVVSFLRKEALYHLGERLTHGMQQANASPLKSQETVSNGSLAFWSWFHRQDQIAMFTNCQH